MEEKNIEGALSVLMEKCPYEQLPDMLRILNAFSQKMLLDKDEYERLKKKLANLLLEVPYE